MNAQVLVDTEFLDLVKKRLDEKDEMIKQLKLSLRLTEDLRVVEKLLRLQSDLNFHWLRN